MSEVITAFFDIFRANAMNPTFWLGYALMAFFFFQMLIRLERWLVETKGFQSNIMMPLWVNITTALFWIVAIFNHFGSSCFCNCNESNYDPNKH
jgi:hypothetical protein